MALLPRPRPPAPLVALAVVLLSVGCSGEAPPAPPAPEVEAPPPDASPAATATRAPQGGQDWPDTPLPTLQPWEPPTPAAATCPPGFVSLADGPPTVLGETDEDRARACACDPYVLRPRTLDPTPVCMATHPFPGEGQPWPSDAQFAATRFSLIEDLRHLLPRWGRRLCSYSEHLFAAAGPDNHRYVEGERFLAGRCEADHHDPDSPIGSHPACRTRDGVMDLNVRSEWVIVDPSAATAFRSLGFPDVQAGMLALTTANTGEMGNSGAADNYGFHFHMYPWGWFDPGDPPGDAYIDDGVRLCATPGLDVPSERQAELDAATARYVSTGDWSALWSVPARDATSSQGGWTAVDAGRNHSCGLRGGQPVCWGSDHWGESSPPDGPLRSITVGWRHACGLTPDGSIRCWGDDAMGQASPPEGTFTTVGAGDFFTCGRRTDGTVACWGKTARDSWTKPPADAVDHLAVGDRNACALTDGAVRCWGETRWPQGPPPDDAFVALSLGYEEACGRTEQGLVRCWGNLDRIRSSIPEARAVASVASGARLRCTVDAAGVPSCVDDLARPELVPPPDARFTALSVGYAHVCGVTPGGRVRCFGGDGFGQASPP